MAKVILVASGKGGVGKSTLCALLGEALASKGHKTLLAELDSGLRSLDVALGVAKDVVFDMGDVARGGIESADAVMNCPFCSGLSLVCASAANVTVDADAINRLLSSVKDEFDFVILDCPAGLGEALNSAAQCAEGAIIVTTPDPAAIRGAAATSTFLQKAGVERRRLVIERCPNHPKKLLPIKNLDEVIDGAGIRLLGVIWEDAETRAAVDAGKMLSSGSPNKKMFDGIAERLLGNRVSIGFK